MEKVNFISMFMASVAVLYPVLGLFWYFTATDARLMSRGYSKAYANALKHDNRRRLAGIAIVLPLLELAAGGIVYLFTGPLETGSQLAITFVVFMVLVVPFPILDTMKSRKKYRDLARETGESVVVDVNYLTLHRMFRPTLEIIGSGAYIAYAVVVDPGFNMGFIHIALLWLLYLSARQIRNATKPVFGDAYMWVFVFMMINHAVIMYHLASLINCCVGGWSNAVHNAGMVLFAFMTVKAFLYLAYSPQIKTDLRIHA